MAWCEHFPTICTRANGSKEVSSWTRKKRDYSSVLAFGLPFYNPTSVDKQMLE